MGGQKNEPVATQGAEKGWLRVEASGFHGQEPGENRWTIGAGTMDSYAGRIAVTPSCLWTAEISAGELHQPEAFRIGNEQRTVASAEHAKQITSASVIFGFGKGEG